MIKKLKMTLAFLCCTVLISACQMDADLNGLNDAASEGNVKKVLELIEQGEDPSGKGWDGDTPLANAIRGEHNEVVKVLLEHGADTKCEVVLQAVYDSEDETIKSLFTEEH